MCVIEKDPMMSTPDAPDDATATTPYPHGLRVRITYTDKLDAQQHAAWRRIWAWVMTPTGATAGATAGNAP